jgi:hypothetical protein
MTTFNSFSSNETLSVFNMSNIKGGAGKQTNNLGINPALVCQLQKKYANAGSQSFVFVNKGISYNVVLNSQMHTMTFTNPKGLSYATKY